MTMMARGNRPFAAITMVMMLVLLAGQSEALNGPVRTVWDNYQCEGSPMGTTQLFSDAFVSVPYGTCLNDISESSEKISCGGGKIVNTGYPTPGCTSSLVSTNSVPTGVCFSDPTGSGTSYLYRCNDTDSLDHTGPDQFGPLPTESFGVPFPSNNGTCPGPNQCTPGTAYQTIYSGSATCNAAAAAFASSQMAFPDALPGVCYNASTSSVMYDCEPGIVRAYNYNYGCNTTATSVAEVHFGANDQCHVLSAPASLTISYHCTPNILPPAPTSSPGSPSPGSPSSRLSPSNAFFFAALAFLLFLSSSLF